jgi:predicted Zn-dependent peptidase
MNRTIAPLIKDISKIDFVKPVKEKLHNGTDIYFLKSGSQEVMRIELIFHAGTSYQHKPLLASFTASMLNEGTKSYNSQQISQIIDYYGAHFSAETDLDYTTLTLYCLSKDFEKLFPILFEIITNPVFPQKELNTQIANAKQRYIVNNDKVEFLARKNFAKAIFGDTHPYGKQAEIDDYDNITPDDLKKFYTHHYSINNAVIIISGNFNETTIYNIFNNAFVNSNAIQIKDPEITYTLPTAQKIFIKKKNAIQNGLRIGKILLNKTHPDFAGMQVLNCALGGYFGSRLMANIREDKGYTYGIGSAIATFKHAAYFFIATEVGTDVCSHALNEIYKEIQILQNSAVPETELEMVKNYMLGNFLKNSDGPFAMADRFKNLYLFGLDYQWYDNYLHTIKTINATTLQELAQKYLKTESLTEVVAGAKY